MGRDESTGGMRLEVDEDGERITLFFGRPENRRRWSRRRRRTPRAWTPQEVNEHTVACYLGGQKLSVVMSMPEGELTEELVREVREVNGGVYMPFEWWGFGGVGMSTLVARFEGPWVLCETWHPAVTEEEARRAARDWVGVGARELSAGLMDVPRWQLLALLEVVRLGAGNVQELHGLS
jgi:hypothetical protein